MNGHVNVRDFGALGDGSADDTLAIRAAMAALPGPGGVLFFPPGHYYGMGKFLRRSRFDAEATSLCPWRGTSVPRLSMRGIYFASHFHNFYQDAPQEKVENYIEDLAVRPGRMRLSGLQSLGQPGDAQDRREVGAAVPRALSGRQGDPFLLAVRLPARSGGMERAGRWRVPVFRGDFRGSEQSRLRPFLLDRP